MRSKRIHFFLFLFLDNPAQSPFRIASTYRWGHCRDDIAVQRKLRDLSTYPIVRVERGEGAYTYRKPNQERNKCTRRCRVEHCLECNGV